MSEAEVRIEVRNARDTDGVPLASVLHGPVVAKRGVIEIDLPAGKTSGLIEARQVLKSVQGIKFIQFTEKDVVRHRLVQKIVRAYEDYLQSKEVPAEDD